MYNPHKIEYTILYNTERICIKTYGNIRTCMCVYIYIFMCLKKPCYNVKVEYFRELSVGFNHISLSPAPSVQGGSVGVGLRYVPISPFKVGGSQSWVRKIPLKIDHL